MTKINTNIKTRPLSVGARHIRIIMFSIIAMACFLIGFGIYYLTKKGTYTDKKSPPVSYRNLGITALVIAFLMIAFAVLLYVVARNNESFAKTWWFWWMVL
jgi:magnesium-transporting ATPase (P-type)